MLRQVNRMRLCMLMLLTASSFKIKAQNIEVAISGIRSTQGQIIIRMYNSQEQFKADTPFMIKKFNKNEMVQGTMTVKFSLAPGSYGFALVDDENNDQDMNYNILGIPKEGFGFSNFYLSGLYRPVFDDFKFALNQNQKQRIDMKIRYM